MPLIEALTVNVAAALAKVILKLWLKDEGRVAVAEGVLDTLKKRFETYQEQRSAQRLLRDLEDEIAPRLERFIEVEFPHLPENERMAAALAVAAALDRLQIVQALIRADLEATRLEAAVHAAAPAAFAAFGDSTRSLAELLLRECCNYIVTISPKLPLFEMETTRELLLRSGSLLQDVARVLDELAAIRHEPVEAAERASAEFEDQYRRTLAQALDRVELFGAGQVGAALREYLTRAYVPSSAVREGSGEPCRVDDALAISSRVIVKGEAGVGKTTLMQYLAVQTARRKMIGPLQALNGRIPFYLRLREFRDATKDFPSPADLLPGPLAHLREIRPQGWALNAVKRGLILIDGIDEVPARRRRQLYEWLRGLHDTCPDAIIFVSSRPAALEADEHTLRADLAGLGFTSVTLEPMTLEDSDTLVVRWHAEIARGLANDEMLAALVDYERSLRNALRERPVIRRLASNPLLASLMCVLNWAQKKHLPDDRMELYRFALEMLLERREKEREIGATHVEGLDRANKQTLLDAIAYWMLRSGASEADRGEAEAQIALVQPRMATLTAEPRQIMQELVERSGVLREPQHGTVDFVHRTFLEYMGARWALGMGDRDALVSNAGQENWRDVIVFAAGHAQGKARDALIERLLKRDWRPWRQRSIEADVTAACCLETVGRDLHPDLLEQLQGLARNLFPPDSFATARVLAAAAAAEPALLEGHADRPPAVVAACIRTASIVGSQRMLEVIASYATVAGEIVDHEIARAYPMFDEQLFDQLVLVPRGRLFGVALASLGAEEAEAFRLLLRYKRARHSAATISVLHHSFVEERLLNLARFDGSDTADDEEDKKARMLAAVQDSRSIERAARRTGVRELERILQLRSLATLRLGEVEPEAIPMLARLPVQHLALSLAEEADLSPLAAMQSLRSLELNGDGISRLSALRARVELNSLSITDASNYSELDCIGEGSQLRQLALSSSKVPSLAPIALAGDIEELTVLGSRVKDFVVLDRLTRLRKLVVGGLPHDAVPPDWPALQTLTEVQLYGTTSVEQVVAVGGAPALNSLVVHQFPSRTLDVLPERLVALEVWRDGKELDIGTIGRFQRLTDLDLSWCVLLHADGLMALPALKKIVLYRCTGIGASLLEGLKRKGVVLSHFG